MSTASRSVADAMKYAQAQWKSGTRQWGAMCQKFVRSAYGIGSGNSSAYQQWLNTPSKYKHVGGHPNDAPIGSALCYKGSGKYGHIMLACNPLSNGTTAAWSNDLVSYGRIHKVPRTAPTTQWGERYLGYVTQINGVNLPIEQHKPPPKKFVTVHDIRESARLDRANRRPHHPLQVSIVENALRREGLLSRRFAGDGKWGTPTKDAYARWQRRRGFTGPDANGMPGLSSLRALGRKHGFSVRS